MKIASVFFEKTAQHDSFEEGCTGTPWSVCTAEFTIKFEGSHDFLQKLAEWVSRNFDVNESDFVTFVSNELENNRFNYNQNEDAEGTYKTVNKQNPKGYLADYTFWINDVYEKIEGYTFKEYRA